MQTSFYDDPARVSKRLQESSEAANYYMNIPGPGSQMPFLQDPQIRLQKWSANLMQDTVNLESDLLGLTRQSRNGDIEEYTKHRVPQHRVYYPSKKPFVEESRTVAPAWMSREVDVSNRAWSFPILNPLHTLEPPFARNLETRILDRDSCEISERIKLGEPTVPPKPPSLTEYF